MGFSSWSDGKDFLVFKGMLRMLFYLTFALHKDFLQFHNANKVLHRRSRVRGKDGTTRYLHYEFLEKPYALRLL